MYIHIQLHPAIKQSSSSHSKVTNVARRLCPGRIGNRPCTIITWQVRRFPPLLHHLHTLALYAAATALSAALASALRTHSRHRRYNDLVGKTPLQAGSAHCINVIAFSPDSQLCSKWACNCLAALTSVVFTDEIGVAAITITKVAADVALRAADALDAIELTLPL